MQSTAQVVRPFIFAVVVFALAKLALLWATTSVPTLLLFQSPEIWAPEVGSNVASEVLGSTLLVGFSWFVARVAGGHSGPNVAVLLGGGLQTLIAATLAYLRFNSGYDLAYVFGAKQSVAGWQVVLRPAIFTESEPVFWLIVMVAAFGPILASITTIGILVLGRRLSVHPSRRAP